jgi:aquaporin Z
MPHAAAARNRAGSASIVAAMRRALACHWPEYLIEAALLGAFMISACVFGTLLGHPASPLRHTLADPFLRRALMGIAMGSTAIALVYSPLGKQSGAHFNPSVTLTFFRLGKIAPWDAVFYVLAQFAGGVAGVVIAATVLGGAVAAPEVRYVVTAPGELGLAAAFVAEVVISFVLMSVVLQMSNSQRFAAWTGVLSGMLVASYITFEAPISGMSMNPARTFASAVPAGFWMALWIYFVAPPIGMLAAAEVYVRRRGTVACAKLHHRNDKRCIFRCGYRDAGRVAEPVRFVASAARS